MRLGDLAMKVMRGTNSSRRSTGRYPGRFKDKMPMEVSGVTSEAQDNSGGSKGVRGGRAATAPSEIWLPPPPALLPLSSRSI